MPRKRNDDDDDLQYIRDKAGRLTRVDPTPPPPPIHPDTFVGFTGSAGGMFSSIVEAAASAVTPDPRHISPTTHPHMVHDSISAHTMHAPT